MTSNPLTLNNWLTLHGFVTAVAVLVYVISSHIMHQRRHPAAAIAWMLFILLVPYLALPAFLAFGSRKLPRPSVTQRPELNKLAGDDTWAVETILALGQPAPQLYNNLQVHKDGHHARNSLFQALADARVSLDVCTFILGRESLGAAIVDLLAAKARQGVRVRLLLDGMGSLMTRHPNIRQLVDAGGAFALFVPPTRSPLKGRTNLRNHRKMVIVDSGSAGARLWCGGRNLANEYFEGKSGEAPWRDLSFDLQGPMVGQASDLFTQDWAFAGGHTHELVPSSVSQATPICAARPDPEGAQLVASGPDQADDTIYSIVVTAIYRSRYRIALATPYFVPESALLMALCLAARRGVTVDLLLPEKSNHRISDLARSRALRSLAAAGGRIWLATGMMHAKLVVVDDVVALAGSANLDSRSLFLNYELMVAFHRATDVDRFSAWFDGERRNTFRYAAQRPGLIRDVAEGMLLWLGFQL